ncbi:MAG TPA: response regulator [Solirubrobacterales bacterium]|nr:response regulator [Solirubrobacterales bacterium]
MMTSEGDHVLVVDDDELDTKLFLQSLEPFGAVATCFDRAFEAISYVESDVWLASGIQLVLLDWKMPGTGAGVLEAIRKSPALRFTPVVVLSRSGEETDIRAAYEAGANAYVVKGNDLDEIERDMKLLYGFWLEVGNAPSGAVQSPW